jgi:hypothetical protein
MDVYCIVGSNVLYNFQNRSIVLEMSSLHSIPARELEAADTIRYMPMFRVQSLIQYTPGGLPTHALNIHGCLVYALRYNTSCWH